MVSTRRIITFNAISVRNFLLKAMFCLFSSTVAFSEVVEFPIQAVFKLGEAACEVPEPFNVFLKEPPGRFGVAEPHKCSIAPLRTESKWITLARSLHGRARSSPPGGNRI